MSTENVVIVGAGPAGLAAAKQLKLYGIDPLVYECDQPGGLLLNACSVINYPGVPEGISGRELIKRFILPSRLIPAEVSEVSRTDYLYEIHTADSKVSALCVIVASGTFPVKISIPGLADNLVHYDVKNITGFSGKSVAIIGGGDAALDYAMSLSSRCTVNVYARGDFSKVVPHLLKKVLLLPAVTLYPESLPQSYFSEDIIVVAAGRTPRVDFISTNLLSSPPADGSFHLCGDCNNGIYRQTAIAVGNGVEAAMKVAGYLKNVEIVK